MYGLLDILYLAWTNFTILNEAPKWLPKINWVNLNWAISNLKSNQGWVLENFEPKFKFGFLFFLTRLIINWMQLFGAPRLVKLEIKYLKYWCSSHNQLQNQVNGLVFTWIPMITFIHNFFYLRILLIQNIITCLGSFSRSLQNT